VRVHNPHIPGWLFTVSISEAGAETTSGVLAWWMLVMVTYPEVQKRAQAELDAVVGRARSPTFADFQHLPYIRAMVKGTLRWRPVGPLASHTSRPRTTGTRACSSRRAQS
jgi:cytochrome P450